MSQTQRYIGAPNGVILCINRKLGREIEGVLYHSYSAEAIPFRTIGEMTLQMEELYDSLKFPFPSTNMRIFNQAAQQAAQPEKREAIMKDETLLSKHGDLGTFIVRVQHRQNSSWQGRITWVEKDQTINFRSVWEMIKLLESAVDTVSIQEDDELAKEPSWDID